MASSVEPLERGGAPAGRIPDFFIVGHPKSGTTALYEMLSGHPDIYMPALKEPRFFASDVRAPHLGGAASSLERYLSLFAGARPDQRAGEATPIYLISDRAAGAIAAAQPRAKIIAILREPASFLRSLHLQFVQASLETERDLRTALSLEDARRHGRNLPRRLRRGDRLMYADYVRYVDQLRRYHAVFPAEQVLVLIYDDFKRDNEATVRRVLRFLEVDDAAAILPVHANPTVHVRSVRLNDMLRGLALGRGPMTRTLKGGVKALAPRRVRRGAMQAVNQRLLYAEPPEPDAELARELRGRFKGEVVALGQYLDRDLVSLWGYDDL